jgi:integrase
MSPANTARTPAHVSLDAALRRIDKMRLELNRLRLELHAARSSRKRPPESLSTEQIRKVIHLIGQEPNTKDLLDIVRIVSNTGLRRNELEALRWTDINFAEHRIKVASQMSTRIRYVQFGSKLAALLEARRQRQPESEFVLGDRPMHTMAVEARRLRQIAYNRGLGVINFHVLRRTFFVRLYLSGVSAISVARIAGWASLGWLADGTPSGSDVVRIAGEEARLEEM